MSVADRHAHPIDAERERELTALLDHPAFAQAVAAYTQVDCAHDVPYGGGSGTDWKTIYWDRRLCEAITAGKFKLKGQPVDPRVTGKVHEAVEGAVIHLWDLCRQLFGWPDTTEKYPRAHDLADCAEKHAVEHHGWDWNEYQAQWKPLIHADEGEPIADPPSNLLLDPYVGTPLYAKLAAAQKGQSTMPPKVPPMMPPGAGALVGPGAAPDESGKLSHAAVHYGLAKPNGDKCATCEHFHGKDNCDLVVAPIYPGGWCEKFAAKAGDNPNQMPGDERAQLTAGPTGADVMAHGRAIAGAKALHAVGHIPAQERDQHIQASQAALRKAPAPLPRKPFGSWAQ